MTIPPRILLATGNAHKAQEMRDILMPILPYTTALLTLKDIGLSSPPDDIEAGDTFSENAIAKAVWCRDRSGMACIADDSGLCADALAGRPGLRSARWAGPADADRNLALLRELERAGAMESEERSARFVCAAAFAPENGAAVVALGTIGGEIAAEESGSGGFGYDPLFFFPIAQPR